MKIGEIRDDHGLPAADACSDNTNPIPTVPAFQRHELRQAFPAVGERGSAKVGTGHVNRLPLVPARLVAQARSDSEPRVLQELPAEGVEVLRTERHIRVEACDEVAMRRLAHDAGVEGTHARASARRVRVARDRDEADPVVRETELAYDILRAVRRPVVDDDPGIGTPRLLDETRAQPLKVFCFIPGGRDDQMRVDRIVSVDLSLLSALSWAGQGGRTRSRRAYSGPGQ
jgi:hypothetical protein